MPAELNADTLDELSAKATAGPWESSNDAIPYSPRQKTSFADLGASISGPKHLVVVGGQQDEQGGAVGVLENADAALIVYLRNHAAEISKVIRERDRLREALSELIDYVGDGVLLMKPEDVTFKNGRIDADSSSSNMEYNEQIRRVVELATKALEPKP